MKIILICSAGMSTSLLVTKMEQAAKARGVECDIEAIPESQANDRIAEANVVLLGPQIRFRLKAIKEAGDKIGVPVDVIDTVQYGMMNGAAVLDKALALLASK